MIPWYVFAFAAAVLSGIVFIIQKKILKTEHASDFSTESSVIVFILSLLLLPFAQFETVTLKFVGLMYVVSIFGATGFLLINKGLRHSKISTIVPLVNFGPMFIAISAFVFLGEKLTYPQVAGIGLLMVGAYVLESNHGMKSLLEPFKKMFGSKYTIFFLVGLVFYAICGTIERFVLYSGMHPITSIIILHFFLSFNYLIYETANGRGLKTFTKDLKKNKWPFALVSLLMLTHRTLAYYAIQLTSAVALVSAIKRMGSLIATLFGGAFFHEDAILKKGIACLILIAGAVLIVVF